MAEKKRNRSVPDYEKGPKRRGPSILLPAVLFVLIVLLLVWAGIAVSVEDPLWFLPVFRTEAAVIDLYWDGRQIRMLPGSLEYNLIQEAVFAELPQVASYADGVGLSDVTLEDLRQRGRLLELYYAEPARLHSTHYFGASKVFYVPLSGFHAEHNRVFNIARTGAVQLGSTQEILTAATVVARQQGQMTPE